MNKVLYISKIPLILAILLASLISTKYSLAVSSDWVVNDKSKVRLIHLSSVSVYGGAREYLGLKKFISENSPIRAKSAYSRSKFNADLYIQNNVK